MLAGRLGVGVLTAIAAASLAAGLALAPLAAQNPAPCQTGEAAQRSAACYLRDAALVRGSGKDGVNAAVADAIPAPDPMVASNAISPTTSSAKDGQADAERHRSNQLTIIGWLVCVFLFAKGLEFALSSAFKMEQEDGPDRLRPAASIAAIGICMAAVIFFVLLALEARRGGPPAKTYSTLSECLHDAQTMDQINACGTGDYTPG